MIQNLHVRQETEKGENVWSARAIIDGEIKWMTMIMDKSASSREVHKIMEKLSKVTAHDPRKRAV